MVVYLFVCLCVCYCSIGEIQVLVYTVDLIIMLLCVIYFDLNLPDFLDKGWFWS